MGNFKRLEREMDLRIQSGVRRPNQELMAISKLIKYIRLANLKVFEREIAMVKERLQINMK